MKITRGMSFALVCAVSVALIWAVFFRESDEDSVEVAGSGELQIKGREFKEEIQGEFKKMVNEESRRTYILTDVCNKYFSAGMLFSDIEIVMAAAGALPDKKGGEILGPSFNHKLPADSPDRKDMAGGFLLEQSLVSHTLFQITFRPYGAGGEPKRLERVVDCFARSTNL
ncbi:hypothetical protein HX881_20465 [Pseudomonas gingeri]|uniref:hypothetical protein n=1 Tax=Pseudomonas gingeri TaxID=117681 RepID=UPI0015A265E2|nr:hypothetical protein [Pseudomonas gingeri]NVZ27938.1 hypothetical protein [Pseudomonas gingeri]